MCGISGIIKFNDNIVEQKDIELVNNALSHRGPDHEGYWYNSDKTIAFGHRRLSIIDLSKEADLPMSYNDRYWITYNGEIFNYIEIREKLKAKSYSFSTNSDTEVILAAYDYWQQDMLNRFNGMWAFAIYDEKKNEVILSRDRYGIKPLYYYYTENILVFASEVQAIHKLLGNHHPLEQKVLENIAMGQFSSFGTEYTYLKNVKSIPGGNFLTIKENKLIKKQWYFLKKISVPKKFEEQVILFKNLIIDAVNLRLRSDVQIGTCLSGGIDSGSITSVINKIEKEQNRSVKNFSHQSFCSSFPNTPFDESEDAKKLAKQKGVLLDIVETECPGIDELEIAMKKCDGPMHALAFYPIWKLYKHIRDQKILVTLDGQGPDEMLGGYKPINDALEAAWQKADPFRFIDVYKTYAAQGESSQTSSKEIVFNALKFFIRQKLLFLPKKLLSFIGLYSFSDPDEYLKSNFIYKSSKKLNALDKSLFNQFFNSPLPAILQQYDRCSMTNSVECRMPFMDYRIVEFVFSLPTKSKVGKGYTKRVLREAMKDILPDEIRLNKRKIGFNAPIIDWFKGPLKDWMLEQMNQKEFLENPYFDGIQLNKDFIKFLDNPKPQWNDAWKFWGPIHIAWWMKKKVIH